VTPEPESEPETPAPPSAPAGVREDRKQERKERKEAQKSRQKEFEQRFEDFGTRLAETIQEGVLKRLERTLGKVGSSRDEEPAPPPRDAADDEAVDEMAKRADTFGDEIRAAVEASLREAGVPQDPPR
jgi:hypothetical protein